MRFSTSRALFPLLAIVPLMLLFAVRRAASLRPVLRQVSGNPIGSLAFSSDGTRLESLSLDETWDTLEGASLASIRHIQLPLSRREPTFASNGASILQEVKHGLNYETGVVDTSTGRMKWRCLTPESSEERTTVDVSQSGETFALTTLSSGRWKCEVWDVASDRKQSGWVSQTDAATVGDSLPAFSPNLDFVVRWNNANTLEMRDVATGRPLWMRSLPPFLQMNPRLLMSPIWAPTGRTFMVLCDDGTGVVFDARTGTPVRKFPPLANFTIALLFSPDGQTIAQGGEGTVDLRSVASGKTLRHITTHAVYSCILAFSPDGSKLAVGNSKGQIELWPLR